MNYGSLSPKASFYKTDGTGRDTYVAIDSGGLYHGGMGKMPGVRVKPASLDKSSAARLDGKTFHYHSDGSGRDNYVT